MSSSSAPQPASENDREFMEFRRKVRDTEVLSAVMQKLLLTIRFSGRLSVIVQNGRVLKCGYEEGYFGRRTDARLLL